MATLNTKTIYSSDEVRKRLEYKNTANVLQLVQRLADDGITVGEKFSGVWVFSEVDVLRMEQFVEEHGRVRRGKIA